MNDASLESGIPPQPAVWNTNFHMKSSMLQLLKIKVLLRGQSHEISHIHLNIFANVCNFFNIANITQESIHMVLLPFFLMMGATQWIGSTKRIHYLLGGA